MKILDAIKMSVQSIKEYVDKGMPTKLIVDEDNMLYLSNEGGILSEGVQLPQGGGSGSGGSTAPPIISDQISAIITTVVLPAADWVVYNISTYSQEISSRFFTVNSMVDLQPTPEQLAVWQDDGLAFNTVNDNGTITVYCTGGKPSEDITVQIKIQEVMVV